ncbi:MAG: aspartate/glutamate racemase family protein [Peptococcaceae bacterium]|jgi:glutamate racemase|nr:aspartate/glutamate racemase family protein [Peptococcaceae bacterium]
MLDLLNRDQVRPMRPIGLFDSGLGGLSVLRALEKRLPAADYLYFGDTARVPYGGRPPEEILRFTLEIGQWFSRRGCGMLLVACNTVSVLGLGPLADAIAPIPVYGMVDAVLAAALAAAAGGPTAVAGSGQSPGGQLPWEQLPAGQLPAEQLRPALLLGTEGTIRSGAYQRAFAQAAPGQPLYAQSCPDLVPLVERGELEGPAVERTLARYLDPWRDKGIRILILGCTHYPFLLPAIRRYVGDEVTVVDPAPRMADLAAAGLAADSGAGDGPVPASAPSPGGPTGSGAGDELAPASAPSPGGPTGSGVPDGPVGRREFFCSGDPLAFAELGGRLLGRRIESVGKVAQIAESR